MQTASPALGKLIPLIYRFVYRPSDYADLSWLDFLPAGKLGQLLAGSSTGQNWISGELQRLHELQPVPEPTFSAYPFQIALFSPDLLKRLILYAGTCLYAEQFSRTVTGSFVRTLSSRLSPQLFAFGQKRAPFLFRPASVLTRLCSPWPSDPEEACALIQRAGKTLLRATFADDNPNREQVWKRLRLKFPAAWTWETDPGPTEIATAAAELLQRILNRELKVTLRC